MDGSVPVWVVLVILTAVGALYASSHLTIHRRISELKRAIENSAGGCNERANQDAALARHSLERLQDDVNAKHHRLRTEFGGLYAHVMQIAHTVEHLPKKDSAVLVEALKDLKHMTKIQRRNVEDAE